MRWAATKLICSEAGAIHCHAVVTNSNGWVPYLIGYIVAAAALGLIPSTIAHHKGYDARRWWLYGFLLFLIALVHSIALRPTEESEREHKERSGHRPCPFCAEMIRPEAIKCRHCGSEVPSV